MHNGLQRHLSYGLTTLVLAIGCSTGSSVVPVEGIVTLDGTPLSDAVVVYNPQKATEPGPYSATTDAAGHYALGTADDPASGATPGEYFVSISTLKTEAATDPANMDMGGKVIRKELVPDEYRRGSTPVTVPPEGTSTANFELKSK